jgi:hypothetical protein
VERLAHEAAEALELPAAEIQRWTEREPRHASSDRVGVRP